MALEDDEMGMLPQHRRGRLRRDQVMAVVMVTAGAVLIAAAATMPWATSEQLTTRSTTRWQSGSGGVVIIILSAVVLMAVAFARVRPHRLVSVIAAGLSGATFAASVVVSLDKISAANSFNQVGPSSTAYSYGAVAAVASSLTMVILSLVGLADLKSTTSEI